MRVGEVLGYVLGWFGGIIQPAVPVPSHDMSGARSSVNVSQTFSENVGAVILSYIFVGLLIQTALVLAVVFLLFVWDIGRMGLEADARVARWMELFPSQYCRFGRILWFRQATL